MSWPARLLYYDDQHVIRLKSNFRDDERPTYAILSHAWDVDNSKEVTFAEVDTEVGRNKSGYEKIRFCAKQAKKDGIDYFWVDTCCIDKANHAELSEAITSMFQWYRNAQKCYVYLADVFAAPKRDHEGNMKSDWKVAFRKSRWFERGWTLQDLLAPKIVDFFSKEGDHLGDKHSLKSVIHAVTSIPTDALGDSPLSQFSISERLRWARVRQTRKPEDRVYCLLGILDVSMPVVYGEGEKKALRRLQREIDDHHDATTQAAHVHWIVPRSPNSLFTGRKDTLQQLEQTIRAAIYTPWERDQCQVVISGIGGEGKSELCLQLAKRLRYLFWAVIWIDVSTSDIAAKSYLDAAAKLSLPVQTWEDARDQISNLSHPWLLVLDNADDPQIDYQPYFPSSRQGVVIMTTRNDDCQQYATDKYIALPGLDAADAQELLWKAARIPTAQHDQLRDDATAVAALLQSHALALVQAGAYIARGHCTLAEYPRVYNAQRQRLLQFRPTQAQSRYGDVYATFEVSAEALGVMNTEAATDALQLLPMLAICAPSQFPLWLFEIAWKGAQKVNPDLADDAEDNMVELLTPWHISRLPRLAGPGGPSWDNFRLIESVNLLKAFSLVSIQTKQGSVYVTTHALVHAWARDRQSPLGQEQAWLQVGCLLAVGLASGGLSHLQERELQPHITATTSCLPCNIFLTFPAVLIARILVRCAWSLYRQYAGQTTFTLVQAIFHGLGIGLLQARKPFVGLYLLRGCTLRNMWKLEEAILMLQQVVAIQVETLAEDHPARLDSLRELAMAYVANGQGREAVTIIEKVVKIRAQTLAEDHPIT